MCEFGISVLKDYWGLGIGKTMTKACIRCAKEAGYVQIELEVVADNGHAMPRCIIPFGVKATVDADA